jgi:hypothetical protein
MRTVAVFCSVSVILGAGGCNQKGSADLYANQDYEEFVGIAVVDPKWGEHVQMLLEHAGIANIVEGSRAYGVSVPPGKKEQAVKLLKVDAIHGYWATYAEAQR